MNDPDIDPKKYVFHSLRHTSASAKLIMSYGDFNSVMHAGGWSSLDMLTRRYGKHSFSSNRENVADKMNLFLEEKEPLSLPDNQELVQKLLEEIANSNPDMLMRVANSVHFSKNE